MSNDRVTLVREICGRQISFVTHRKPHLDEFWSVRMIEEKATPTWLDAHTVDNVIKLGIDGCEFDDHSKDLKKSTDCCLTLVAKSLGLDKDPAYQDILKWMFGCDKQGTGHPFDVYNGVKLLNEEFPDDPERVYDWAEPYMAAKEAQQRDFVLSTAAVKAALFDKRVLVVRNNNAPETERELNILIVESAGKTVMSAAISLMKTRLAVVIQRQPDQSVQIYTNKRSGASLREAIRFLRIAELRQKKSKEILDERTLRQSGRIELVPEFYYFPEGEMIFNRSLTETTAPITQLSTQVIADCVQLGLDRHFNMKDQRTAKASA